MVTKFVLSSGIDTSPFKTKEELHGGGNHDKKVVTDLIKPKENKKEEFIPCSKIDYEYDEFEYTKKYSTASSYDEQVERPHDPAYYAGEKTETKTIWYNTVFYKNIEKGQPTYYLALEIPSSTPTHNKGVIIILNNGSRINRPLEKVTTRVRETESDEPYMVRSFMRLKQTDISLLKSSPIKEFELFADQAYSVQSEKVYQMFLCLLTKK